MSKILIIDDEQIIHQRLAQLLELDDYETVTAENGRLGLELLDRENPDIVLVDIKMPGMDGIEVLTNIKARGAKAEVIMITGHGGAETAIEALREGAFSYLQKPVDYDELEIDIKKALEKRDMTRKLDEYVEQLETLVDEKSREIERRIEVEKELDQHRQQLEAMVAERTEELHSSKKYLDSLIESMADALLVLNLDGSIRFANKSAELILGRLPYSLTKVNISSVMADESLWPSFLESIRKGNNIDNRECVFMNSQNHEVPILLSCSALPDKNDQVSGMIWVAKDITDIKEAEKKLKANQAKLIHTDRLSSLGEMATGIAHEINQPLTYINTMIQLVIEKCKSQSVNPDKLLPKFERALHQATRITKIIDHLRSFSRIDNKDCEPLVDLKTVLDDALILMTDKMRLNDVTFSCEIEQGLPGIYCNSNKIEQVFVNLFQNAIDALAEQENKIITVHMARYQHDFVSICVEDNGQGMSPEVQKKIFDPFFTTKDPGKGTGLGMAISFSIIKSFQGEVSCESALGQGAKFTIRLPQDRRRHQGV